MGNLKWYNATLSQSFGVDCSESNFRMRLNSKQNTFHREKSYRRWDGRSIEFHSDMTNQDKTPRRQSEAQRQGLTGRYMYHRSWQLKIIIGRIRGKDGEASGAGNSADRLEAVRFKGKPVAADWNTARFRTCTHVPVLRVARPTFRLGYQRSRTFLARLPRSSRSLFCQPALHSPANRPSLTNF